MPRTTGNGIVLAEGDAHQVVEGNVYFPRSALRTEHFEPSPTSTRCPWKGVAHYYTVRAADARNPDAARYHPEPKPAAANIRDDVAFWRGMLVER